MIRSARQRQPAIADDDLGANAAILGVLQESEIAPGDRFHGWVDFIEGPFLAGFRIASQGAGTETEDRHTLLFRPLRQRIEKLADRSGARIIGQRLTALRTVAVL